MTRKTFDKNQLKKAYRKLAKQYHPDKNPDNPEAVQQLMSITEAYETLDDDNKRKIYDTYGKEGLKSGANGAGDFHPEDIFKQFFGSDFDFGSFGGGGHHHHHHRHHHHRAARTADTKVELTIPLADAYRGATLTVSLNRQKKCSKCKGVGAEKPDDIIACSECQGQGYKIFTQQIGMGFYQRVQVNCNKCNGQGRVFKTVCNKCRGQKVSREDEQLQIKIDPGCPNGHVIKIQGGSDEAPNAETGDLYIIVRTEEHAVFKRDGAQLYTEMVIGLREALLGFNKTLKHLDGRSVVVQRDAVTQPNQVLTINEEGMPEHGNTAAGNLYIHMRVLLPEKLTEQEKLLFRNSEFSKIVKDEL